MKTKSIGRPIGIVLQHGDVTLLLLVHVSLCIFFALGSIYSVRHEMDNHSGVGDLLTCTG